MMSARINEIKLDIEELNRMISIASRQKVKDVLSIEARKLQTELLNFQSTVQNGNNDKPALPLRTAPKSYDVKLKDYGWDQTQDYVKIYVSLNDVHTLPETAVLGTFSSRSMELRVSMLNNKNYFLPINNLSEDIDIENSYHKIKNNMIIINLAKVHKNKNWSCVTGVEKKIKDAKSNVPQANKEDPESSLMDLMKKMYQEGDDDMKRTIAKAWTESRNKTPELNM